MFRNSYGVVVTGVRYETSIPVDSDAALLSTIWQCCLFLLHAVCERVQVLTCRCRI